MQQRVNLARALSVVRPVLLLDEPLQSLDLSATMEFAAALRTRTKSERRATLAVTHDVAEALLLADTVLVLAGTPASVVATMDVSLSEDQRDPRDPEFQKRAAEVYSLLLANSHA
jgi:NitT/TauT family transport system ATP-binding protein